MVKVLTDLFNMALNFPKAFKFGLLIPIPKPGKRDHTEKGNSQSITLLTTIGKLYEKVIKDRIVKDFKTRGVELTSKMQGTGKQNDFKSTHQFCSERNYTLYQ